MDPKALSLLTRRGLLRAAGAASLMGLAACVAPAALRQPAPAGPSITDPGLLDDLERRTFDFFWDTSDPPLPASRPWASR